MATLQLTYQNLYDEVSHFLGLTARGTTPTGQDLTTCKDIVARGYRQFLYPIDARNGTLHEWNFLRLFTTLSTVSGQWKYALPQDFSDLCGTILYDTDELQPPMMKVDAKQILNMRSDVVTTEWPKYFAIVPVKYDLALGTTYELWVYPTPDKAYILNYFYRFDPLKPSATTDLVVGGIRACEAILESCLAIAETQEDDNVSQHHQMQAAKLIQTLIIADTITDTGKIGNLYSDKDRVWPPNRPFLVPFKDANIYDGGSGTTTDEFAT